MSACALSPTRSPARPGRRRARCCPPTRSITLLWQEPLSALYAQLQQGKLDDGLAKLEGTEPTAPTARCSRSSATSTAGSPTRRARSTGAPTTASRWAASACARSACLAVVVAGTDTARLRRGPGHYPATPLPGARGTVAIAGHRTTYGAPFRRLDQLGRGDRIELSMPYGRFTYRGRAAQDRAADGHLGDPPRRLRPARAVGLPPALLGREADRRVRPLVRTKPRNDRLA